MSTFLQILGAVFLAVILLALVAVLVLGLKLRRVFRTLSQTASQVAAALQPQPAVIHLEGPRRVAWGQKARVHALADPLPSLGYHDAGQFTVREVPGLHLWAFVNPSESSYAVVYEHPAGLVWMDFVTRYQDGSRLTVTNNDQGEPLEKPPGDHKVYHPEADTAELHRRHREAQLDAPREPASAGAFRELFETAYAEEMAWRNSRGGPTPREIRAIAERSNLNVTAEEIEAIQQAMAEQAARGLDEALRDHFIATAALPPRQWEQVRDRLLFVHDHLTPEMLAERIEEWLDEAPEFADDDHFPDDLSARETFLRYNATLPAAERFVKIGELDEPVPADVYRAAE